jgi:hypothetical protein
MSQPSVRVQLTLEEVALLRDLAHFYERSMGPFRSAVRLTSRAAIRNRFRFVAQESSILWQFAEATHREMTELQQDARQVELTPRTLVAFWGRVLASLNTRRSRRRLSEAAVAEREVLANKLAEAAEQLARTELPLLQQELATRRQVEADWMEERLQLRNESA